MSAWSSASAIPAASRCSHSAHRRSSGPAGTQLPIPAGGHCCTRCGDIRRASALTGNPRGQRSPRHHAVVQRTFPELSNILVVSLPDAAPSNNPRTISCADFPAVAGQYRHEFRAPIFRRTAARSAAARSPPFRRTPAHRSTIPENAPRECASGTARRSRRCKAQMNALRHLQQLRSRNPNPPARRTPDCRPESTAGRTSPGIDFVHQLAQRFHFVHRLRFQRIGVIHRLARRSPAPDSSHAPAHAPPAAVSSPAITKLAAAMLRQIARHRRESIPPESCCSRAAAAHARNSGSRRQLPAQTLPRRPRAAAIDDPPSRRYSKACSPPRTAGSCSTFGLRSPAADPQIPARSARVPARA